MSQHSECSVYKSRLKNCSINQTIIYNGISPEIVAKILDSKDRYIQQLEKEIEELKRTVKKLETK